MSATAPGGTPAESGQPEGGHPAAAPGQQPVGVAVVAAGELDDPVPSREAAGHPDGAHGGLGPRGHQPDLLAARDALDGWPRPAGPRPRWARRTWCPGRPPSRTAADHRGMGVTEDGGAVGLDEVEQAVAVGVPHVGALAPGHEVGVPADRAGRTAPAS